MTILDDEDPADPIVHEPRVTDPPNEVWLVYGELERDATHHECCVSGEVTWCEESQFPSDIRYVRADAPELSSLRKDTERYRFTRDHCFQYFEGTTGWKVSALTGEVLYQGVAWGYQAAVDAAMIAVREAGLRKVAASAAAI